MIEIGDVVKTSYGTGPFKIVSVKRGCTCPRYLDTLRYPLGSAPQSQPHLHLTCERTDRKHGKFWLNGYDEKGRSVWGDDYLTVIAGTSGVQLQLLGLPYLEKTS